MELPSSIDDIDAKISAPKQEVRHLSNEIIEDGGNTGNQNLDDTCYFNIGYNIFIRGRSELSTNVQGLKAIKWTSEEKNKLQPAVNLPMGFKFVSDIFRIINGSDNSTENSIKKFSVVISRDSVDKICFKLSIHCNVNEEQCIKDFSAWINDGTEWTLRSASITDGYVEFDCTQVNSFAIVCFPKRFKHVVGPVGSRLVPGDSIHMTLVFQKETVKSEQEFTYWVVCPDHTNCENKDSSNLIRRVTHRINFEYDKSKYMKPIKVFTKDTAITSVEKGVIKIIGFKNNVPSVVLPASKTKKIGQYMGKVSGCDGVCFVAIKPYKQNENTLLQKLQDELDLVYGLKIKCNLFLFFHKKVSRTLYLVAECCLKSNREKVLSKQALIGNKVIFQSKDLYLPSHQRLRIHPTCSVGSRPGSALHYSFCFISTSDDNRLSLEVEITKHLGGSPNAIVQFLANNRKNTEITRAEFNLDSLLLPTGVPLNQTPMQNCLQTEKNSTECLTGKDDNATAIDTVRVETEIIPEKDLTEERPLDHAYELCPNDDKDEIQADKDTNIALFSDTDDKQKIEPEIYFTTALMAHVLDRYEQ